MRIGIIGSGNVADVLAVSFYKAGNSIAYISARHAVKAKRIASKVKAPFLSINNSSFPQADLIILAVSDNAIPSVSGKFKKTGSPIVHTSGATSMAVFKGHESYGVLYPVVSIISGTLLETGTIFCIEANNSKLQSALKRLVKSLQLKSVIANSDQRLAVHVAAVFANNFVNSCYQSAHDILKEKKIDFNILEPLMKSTLNKALKSEPRLNQTGPAVRNDSVTLKKHKQYLSSNKNLQKIYASLSGLILSQQKK
jgi:predicted short-subunit dehydrogenase-like oxidoreductase (DUF2520 family)